MARMDILALRKFMTVSRISTVGLAIIKEREVCNIVENMKRLMVKNMKRLLPFQFSFKIILKF